MSSLIHHLTEYSHQTQNKKKHFFFFSTNTVMIEPHAQDIQNELVQMREIMVQMQAQMQAQMMQQQQQQQRPQI